MNNTFNSSCSANVQTDKDVNDANTDDEASLNLLSNENNIVIDLESLKISIMKPGLEIGCLNIRGFLDKLDELSAILRTCQFDLMCRCETFLGDTVADDEIQIQGYSVEPLRRYRHVEVL